MKQFTTFAEKSENIFTPNSDMAKKIKGIATSRLSNGAHYNFVQTTSGWRFRPFGKRFIPS